MQRTLPFASMTDAEITAALQEYRIGLTVDEARAVQTMLGRPPTITEAVIWGIQGSEHCSYKSSRRFLKVFPTTGTHVILGPKEDSGIVAITDGPPGKRWGIVLSHESHNHPSQIVPYEGAATGVGGCVRDVACMGARVIGSLDSLRLGDLHSDATRAIAVGVVRGIAGYGNALGIPNLGGDTVFDRSYNGSCLVNVVSVGLIREDEIIHSYVPEEAGKVGYDIIVVGKATDRSGFGGASFASVVMEEGDKEKNAGAVQEPNPFLERHLLASTYALFDWLVLQKHLDKVSFKDLGAGGNVCASVEQVAPRGMGAEIDLDRIHTALPDLPPQVIGCAETQERFCWVCHPSITTDIVRHYNETWDLPSIAEGARASVIGRVIPEDRYVLTHRGDVVCDAPSTAITSGLQYTRPTAAPVRAFREPEITCDNDAVTVLGKTWKLQDIAHALLMHPTNASKQRITRHYDKNILGNTILEPGEGDATVIAPLMDVRSYESEIPHDDWSAALRDADRALGVALVCGGNGRYGRISPYLQGALAVAENVRNLAAVGAEPRAITDCLNYGNPEVPEQLWALEEGVRGIADACRGLGETEPIPVISGNVSLYNVTKDGPIDPTANVSIVGVLPDAHAATGSSVRHAGSKLYLIGARKDECGGSAYYATLESLSDCKPDALLGANVPTPDFPTVRAECAVVKQSVRQGLVHSAHDISEGGLFLALFEMTSPWRGIDRGLGLRISLDHAGGETLRSDTLLFSETGGFLLEVASEHESAFLDMASQSGVEPVLLGEVIDTPVLTVSRGTCELLSLELPSVRSAWARVLDDLLGLA